MTTTRPRRERHARPRATLALLILAASAAACGGDGPGSDADGAASVPQPATHCQPIVLLARSASTSVSQNQRAPSIQLTRRFFVRNDATIIRTRLCIQPVCQSSRMPASTIG